MTNTPSKYEDILKNLSPKEKEIALQALKELARGDAETLNKLKYADYDEIPVDIETFLYDKKYLGSGLIDPEGRFTVFPYWVDKLKEIFPDNVTTKYNTLVLTGSIGIGKSFMAILCMLYLLHRMLCLKDPYTFYGLQPIDKITFSLINVTIDAAKGVAWDKLQQLVQSSPWFMSHGNVSGRSEIVWAPNKRIELVVGSNNNAVIGRAVFSNFTDEVNFSAMTTDIEKIKAKQKLLISQVDARMQSRFMKGTKLPTLQIIASSKGSDQSFLDSYINTKKKNNSKTTLIVDEPQWVVRNDKDSPVKFPVAVGNKFLASEVLPIGASEELIQSYRAKGYQILMVPEGYYEAFIDNVELALTDIAGISTTSALKYISGVRLNNIKFNSYRNPFTRDIIEVGTGDDLQYSRFFDVNSIPSSCKYKPLYIHLDMSKSGDKTGIAGVWIMGKRAGSGEDNQSKEAYYRVAFSVSIKAPKGFEISFEKNKTFIRWLKAQGFNIKGITMDTYQSAQIKQQLIADGFDAKILSVDRLDNVPGTKTRICLPYAFFKSAIYEQRLELYEKCDLLTDEIVGLEKEPDGHIEHPEGGTQGSKDQCLHGDTRIFTLDGQHATIRELYESQSQDCWILAYNTVLGKIEPVRVLKFIRHDVRNDLLKLTLDNGEYLICTSDHKLLTRDGSYVEAKDSKDISLMPFTYENREMYQGRDYTYVYNPNPDLTTSGTYLHKLVAESQFLPIKESKQANKSDKEWIVIHHKDCNRFNNSPYNLEYLTNTEHSLKHVAMNSSEHKRKQLRLANKRRIEEGTHSFCLMTTEQRRSNGRKSILKLNKSLKHREAISQSNKFRLINNPGNMKAFLENSKSLEADVKRRNTLIQKYSVDRPFKSTEVQVKCREACLRNNGYDNPLHSAELQCKMRLHKYYNAWLLIKRTYNLDDAITLFDFKVYSYALNLNGISGIAKDLKAAGVPLTTEQYDVVAYKRLRSIGNIVKLFIKEHGSDTFTFKEFEDYHVNKLNTDRSYKKRFKRFSIKYEDIVRLGFKVYNHRVVDIQEVNPDYVYDIQLDRIHNFALSCGIFVHNCDAVCGALYNASQNIEQFAFDYGETLDDMLKASDLNDSNQIKQQITIEFEQELQNLFTPKSIKEQKKNDNASFIDFGMGYSTPMNGPYVDDNTIIW